MWWVVLVFVAVVCGGFLLYMVCRWRKDVLRARELHRARLLHEAAARRQEEEERNRRHADALAARAELRRQWNEKFPGARYPEGVYEDSLKNTDSGYEGGGYGGSRYRGGDSSGAAVPARAVDSVAAAEATVGVVAVVTDRPLRRGFSGFAHTR